MCPEQMLELAFNFGLGLDWSQGFCPDLGFSLVLGLNGEWGLLQFGLL